MYKVSPPRQEIPVCRKHTPEKLSMVWDVLHDVRLVSGEAPDSSMGKWHVLAGNDCQ